MQQYISINLSKQFDTQLFQLAALNVYANMYNKLITIPNQSDFLRHMKLFDEFSINDYHEISDKQDSFKIIPYGINVMLRGDFASFKKHSEHTLEFMRDILYSNKDYMYEAYEEYNKIKKHFQMDSDDNMVSIYYDNDYNMSYYTKAMILMNKQNIVIFSPDVSLLQKIITDNNQTYVYWNDNIYVRFILLSFFRHNIIASENPYFSLWAAYISKYECVKDIVVPSKVKTIMNSKLGNLNINYLD